MSWYRSYRGPLNSEMAIAYKSHLLDFRKISPRTANNRFYAARAFMTWMVQTDRIGKHPFYGVRPARIPVDRHARECLNKEQLSRFLFFVGKNASPREKAILYIMVFQGLRVAEITRLNRDDVRELDGKWVISVLGKGFDAVIDMPLLSPVRDAIRAYIRNTRRNTSFRGPLFPGQRSERLTPDSISRICKKFLRMSGLDDTRVTAHSIRHTFMTMALRSGTTIEVVRQMGRHASIATTQIYTHIDSDQILASFERLKNSIENA